MECGNREIAVFDAGFLRQLAQMLKDRLDQTRPKELIAPT